MSQSLSGRLQPHAKRDKRADPCKCQKCERELMRDADICYAKLGASHNDVHDIDGNPTCGACLNVPSIGGDWRPELLTRHDQDAIHRALRDRHYVKPQIWQKIVKCLQIHKDMDDPHAGKAEGDERWLESSMAFRRRQARSRVLLLEIFDAAVHKRYPKGALTPKGGWGRGGNRGRKGH